MGLNGSGFIFSCRFSITGPWAPTLKKSPKWWNGQELTSTSRSCEDQSPESEGGRVEWGRRSVVSVASGRPRHA